MPIDNDERLHTFIDEFVTNLREVYDNTFDYDEMVEAVFDTVVPLGNAHKKSNFIGVMKTSQVHDMKCPLCNNNIVLVVNDTQSMDGGSVPCPHCKETIHFSASVKFDALPF